MDVSKNFDLNDEVIHTPTNDKGIIVKINYEYQHMTAVMKDKFGKTREHSVWQFRKIEDNSINKYTEYDYLMVKNLVDLQLRAEAKAKADAEAKAKVESEAKVKAEAKAKAEAKVKAEAEAEAKVKAEAESKEEAKNKKINDNNIRLIMILLNNSLNTDFYRCVEEFKKEIEQMLNEKDAKRIKKIFESVFLIEDNIEERIKKLNLLLNNELITMDQIIGHYRHKIIPLDILKLILSRSKIDQEFGNLFNYQLSLLNKSRQYSIDEKKFFIDNLKDLYKEYNIILV
jgi:hypothetical protein